MERFVSLVKQGVGILRPYLASKRTWVVIGAIAVDATGLLPDKIVHYLTVVSIIGTKIVDTVKNS